VNAERTGKSRSRRHKRQNCCGKDVFAHFTTTEERNCCIEVSLACARAQVFTRRNSGLLWLFERIQRSAFLNRGRYGSENPDCAQERGKPLTPLQGISPHGANLPLPLRHVVS
jgi:hypothetical protein